ncbi:MAG: hypothetical protein A3C64_00215 [Candidatus Yanofskybacteria bacterium RIFCSPHIGHO2_02_FULL_41_12]|nr:MAG: hypothetical protein A3C64_00215 [Candidatus Yanofskybacteria bacterium RIFCSPHIGHO2_02_FULL_41_12]
MPSTKIINVLKDDKFEEILDIFKNTQAKEVIFVLPKKNNALKDEEHFIILSNEAQKADKTVSLLCSNPEINALGKRYDFDILMPKPSSSSSNKSPNKPIMLVNQIEPDEQRDEEDNDIFEKEEKDENKLEQDGDEKEDDEEKKKNKDEETEDENLSPAVSRENRTSDDFDIITTSAPFKTNRSLSEIIKSKDEDKINIKILQRKEQERGININKSQAEEKTNQIKSVWQFNDSYSESSRRKDDSLWNLINLSGKRFLKIKKIFGAGSPKYLVILCSGILILLFAAVFLISGSAKIDIKPQKKEINFSLKISASDKYSSVDTTFNKIPGQLFNIEEVATQTFQATGQREVAQKAKGAITVYNEYGTTPQTLIATTRFESPEGFIFRTLKTIVVPGTKVENGKIIPGSISVEIIADKPGPSYNISPSKFTIPAFKEKGDTDRYGKFYGQSSEPMKGGVSGMAKVITDSDYTNAISALTAAVKTAVAESLQTQTSGLKIINASAVTMKNPDSNARIDEATDSFIMTVSGFIKTIGFKQEDLNKILKQYAEKDSNITVVPDKLDVSFDKITLTDNNFLDFTVSVKGNGYAQINTQKILSDILGNNTAQIKNYFQNAKEITSAKVLLSPFWIKKIPKNKEKIRLNLIYD